MSVRLRNTMNKVAPAEYNYIPLDVVNVIISPCQTDPRLYYQSAWTDTKLYHQSGDNYS